MKKVRSFSLAIIVIILSFVFISESRKIHAQISDTRCSGTVIDLGFPRKLLPFRELARPGRCGVKPTKIVIHTTWGPEQKAQDLWNYFASANRAASTHFVVGKDGSVLQMLETLTDKAEIGWAVSYFNDDSISIELTCRCNYNSKSEMPSQQYEQLLKLVRTLMGAYNIPVGNVEYNAINNANNPAAGGPISKSTQGIFGHYQLSPDDRSDPGQGLLRDLRAEAKQLGPLPVSGVQQPQPTGETTQSSNPLIAKTACVITKVGNPQTPRPDPLACKNLSSVLTDIFCSNPPATPTNIVEAIKAEWNITLANIPSEQALAIYEIFYRIKDTSFLTHLKSKAVVINPEPGTTSYYRGGCKNIYLANLPKNQTQTTVIHELAHLFSDCFEDSITYRSKIQVAYQNEGGLTEYSRTACGERIIDQDGDGVLSPDDEEALATNLNEDYAETLSFHLNPMLPTDACANDGNVNPFSTGKYPQHKLLAERIVGKYACTPDILQRAGDRIREGIETIIPGN
jgi:hypothetical protein